MCSRTQTALTSSESGSGGGPHLTAVWHLWLDTDGSALNAAYGRCRCAAVDSLVPAPLLCHAARVPVCDASRVPGASVCPMLHTALAPTCALGST